MAGLALLPGPRGVSFRLRLIAPVPGPVGGPVKTAAGAVLLTRNSLKGRPTYRADGLPPLLLSEGGELTGKLSGRSHSSSIIPPGPDPCQTNFAENCGKPAPKPLTTEALAVIIMAERR